MDRLLEFAGNHTLLVTALVASFLLLIFSEMRRKAGAGSNVEPNDAVRLLNDNAAVIDLRSADAYGRGHIVNARNVPADELEARLEKLGELKSSKVVLVCDAGLSSGKSVELMRKAGFESVFSLKGGMNNWTQAGLPVVSGKKTKTAK